jgi:hypothetical protein
MERSLKPERESRRLVRQWVGHRRHLRMNCEFECPIIEEQDAPWEAESSPLRVKVGPAPRGASGVGELILASESRPLGVNTLLGPLRQR